MRKLTLQDIGEMAPKKALLTTPVNRIIFVNDRSGSMRALHSRVTADVQKRIEALRESDKRLGQKSFVTIWDFSTYSSNPLSNVPVETATYRGFVGHNNTTALNATVREAIDGGLKIEPLSTDESFLVIILTDGGNNQHPYEPLEVAKVIKQLPENWTVTIIGPPANMTWAKEVGIPEGNRLEWDGRVETYGTTSRVQETGLGEYVRTRSIGGSSVRNFYEVRPDKIQDDEVEKLKKLRAVDDYTLLSVPHSLPPATSNKMELKDLVTSASLKFRSGVNYYQLVKPEKIKAHKDLLIYDPSSGNLYGAGNSGEEVRRALGIPTGTDVLVHPKKGKYEIFIQSDSHNRKMLAWTDKSGNKVSQKLVVLR